MTDAEQIAQLQAELAAARAEMQAFAATVSHDLRAPLRHITSFAQLLQEEAGPQLQGESAEFLDHITSAARQLDGMLDALLALSRVGTAPLQRMAVVLQELLEPLVLERQTALHDQTPPRTVQWELDCGDAAVLADAPLLRAALAQVLDNAIKFSRGRADAAIAVRAEWDASTGHVVCTVQDNGVGFLPEQAGKLFKPFIRLHPVRQFEGQGMGLAMVAKSLQRMGGQARITASLQGGCAVALELPGANEMLLKI